MDKIPKTTKTRSRINTVRVLTPPPLIPTSEIPTPPSSVEQIGEPSPDNHPLVQVIEQNMGTIQRIVGRVVLNATDTEDVVSETILKAWKARESYSPRHGIAMKSWVFQIAHHAAIDYKRSLKSKRNPLPIEEATAIPDTAVEPEDQAVNNELSAKLAAVVTKLTPEQQFVIVSRFVQGCSLKETAEAMSKSEDAIKQLQQRGLKSLRQLLGNDKGNLL